MPRAPPPLHAASPGYCPGVPLVCFLGPWLHLRGRLHRLEEQRSLGLLPPAPAFSGTNENVDADQEDKGLAAPQEGARRGASGLGWAQRDLEGWGSVCAKAVEKDIATQPGAMRRDPGESSTPGQGGLELPGAQVPGRTVFSQQRWSTGHPQAKKRTCTSPYKNLAQRGHRLKRPKCTKTFRRTREKRNQRAELPESLAASPAELGDICRWTEPCGS